MGYKPRVFYFSDSEITLYRLKKPPDSYKVWVANRLKAIHDLTNYQDWKKVDTAENPADITSRGAYLPEIMDSQLYLHGPQWLVDPHTKFKQVGIITAENFSLDSEEKKNDIQTPVPQMNVAFTSTGGVEVDMIKKLLDRQNNWRTTVKILSWCKRFYTNQNGSTIKDLQVPKET